MKKTRLAAPLKFNSELCADDVFRVFENCGFVGIFIAIVIPYRDGRIVSGFYLRAGTNF
jgi:hypothetical protein